MKTLFKLTVMGAALLVGLAGCSSQKEVPLLEGMDLKEAQARIVELGFQVGRVDNEFTGLKDAGKVLRQLPAASTRVEKGTTIHLTIEESVTMPDLSGLDAESATRTLTSLGLRVQKLEKKVMGGAIAGVIVSQVPAPGDRVAPRSMANLVMDDFVVVPDFTGDTYESIRKTLPQSGLTLGKKYYKGSTEKAGTILDQIPEAGAKVARDTAIQFELAQAVANTGSRNGTGNGADNGRNNSPFDEATPNQPTKPKKDVGNVVGGIVGNAISNAIGDLIEGKNRPKDKNPTPPPPSRAADSSESTNNVAPKTPGKKALDGFIGRFFK